MGSTILCGGILKQQAIPVKGFYDYYCFAENKAYENLSITKNNLPFEFTDNEIPTLVGKLLDEEMNQVREISLIPMGKTVLRRVTFPLIH